MTGLRLLSKPQKTTKARNPGHQPSMWEWLCPAGFLDNGYQQGVWCLCRDSRLPRQGSSIQSNSLCWSTLDSSPYLVFTIALLVKDSDDPHFTDKESHCSPGGSYMPQLLMLQGVGNRWPEDAFGHQSMMGGTDFFHHQTDSSTSMAGTSPPPTHPLHSCFLPVRGPE